MKTIIKISIIVVIAVIGIHLLGYEDAVPYIFNAINDSINYILAVPIVNNVVNDYPTVSSLVTIAVVILGISYAIIHFVESLFKGVASTLGRQHQPFKSKNSVKKLFHTAIIIKILLLVFKLVLIVTKAWSLSQFFHWVIGDPNNVWQLIKNDALFFIVLTIIVLIGLYKRQTQKQYNPA